MNPHPRRPHEIQPNHFSKLVVNGVAEERDWISVRQTKKLPGKNRTLYSLYRLLER